MKSAAVCICTTYITLTRASARQLRCHTTLFFGFKRVRGVEVYKSTDRHWFIISAVALQLKFCDLAWIYLVKTGGYFSETFCFCAAIMQKRVFWERKHDNNEWRKKNISVRGNRFNSSCGRNGRPFSKSITLNQRFCNLTVSVFLIWKVEMQRIPFEPSSTRPRLPFLLRRPKNNSHKSAPNIPLSPKCSIYHHKAGVCVVEINIYLGHNLFWCENLYALQGKSSSGLMK